jgi:hypothetical protein
MTDEPEKEENPKGEPGKGPLKFEVNSQAMEYLEWLKDHTTLGRSINEVARQILIQRLSKMRQEKYKD